MVKIFKKLAGLSNLKNNFAADEGEDDNLNEIMEDANPDQDELEAYDDAVEEESEEAWPTDDYEEGQLSIDVFQTPESIVVKSTIAGVKTEDIDISINNDMLTIRGKRELNSEISDKDYLFKECYWGSFSRSIILPVEIQEDKIEALLENGVLTVILPKAKTSKQINIKVKEK